MSGGAAQQLRVVVHYSDGSTRDVTQWPRYDTQLAEVLSVIGEGRVETTGRPGEGSVLVRYADHDGRNHLARLLRGCRWGRLRR